MFAVEFIEVAIVGGVMLWSVPPIPIAAFGNQNLFKGQFALRLGRAGGRLVIKVAGMVEVIPGAVVLGSADPNVEIGMNSGAGNERGKLAEIFMSLNRLGYGDGFDAGLVL